MNKPIIAWNPFGRKPLPRRFPVPRPHAKKRRKIIPWKNEEWHVVRGDTVRKDLTLYMIFKFCSL